MGKRIYGQWAGDERGVPEDETRCYESVYPAHTWVPSQCSRKRGYGPGGLYCKQHAKKHKALPLNYTNDESGAA